MPEVRTTAGRVRGRTENGLAVFRGIPFAQPPVGKLRLQAPVPCAEWHGVREAFAFGPPPPQASNPVIPWSGSPLRTTAAVGDPGEWLTVNVWSPDTQASGLPVLVWIYGGGFMRNSSAGPTRDGSHLAAQGRIVVVSFNYRVSVEGFGRFDGAPDNRGLLDQIAALEWVRDNIAAFGGDPANVTVGGESAGACSVAILLGARPARGLFHRAIVQSFPGVLPSLELATDIATVVADRVGRRPTLGDLVTVDPQTLAEAAAAVAKDTAGYQDRWGYELVVTPTLVGPVIDPVVVPEMPERALARGAGKDVALLVGHSRDEFDMFIMSEFGGPDAITAEQADQALRELSPAPDGPRVYRSANPGASDAQLFSAVCSDAMIRIPTVRLARAHTGGGGTTHLFELCYDETRAGAGHCIEMPLIFDTFDSDFGRWIYGSPPPDTAVALGEQMRSAWLSFIRTGDPGWPTYTPQTRQTRIFDVRSRTARYPERDSDRIWEGVTFEPLPLRQQ
ncbi:carboxylesterase/lipase family protein [Nocardia transvalensis]|uniref:carboxylesterase/lipase family protein n=1 Tax=Nocardia transvalensis TaxID=37333 RepID=UPI0018958B8C|nr:carboxylesterase family protein [Nocardia transvalensis]MBF6331446.1 carboxylesterase/lipase family protein [Nocardia transvalensis]